VPLSDTTVFIAASLSMSLSLMPQVRPRILITPVVVAVVFAAYVPMSFRAEDRSAALIARWFRSASWLLGTLGTDSERVQQAGTTDFCVRLAYHRQAIEHIPRQLTRGSTASSGRSNG
jgi:hypothetical protein